RIPNQLHCGAQSPAKKLDQPNENEKLAPWARRIAVGLDAAPSFATQRLHDRRGERPGMARVWRSYEVVIDYDRRILDPGCTGGFSVRLNDQFGVRHAVIEPRHAATSNDLRAGRQHRSSAAASDNSASSTDVLHELGYARIFGKQGRAFCTTWNENAHVVLGPGVRYRTLDIQQASSREIAVNLHGLLARGHHLDLVASLIEGNLGKEVLLLLKRVSNQGGNLWACVVHSFLSPVCLLPGVVPRSVTHAGERDRAGSSRGPTEGGRGKRELAVPLTINFPQ